MQFTKHVENLIPIIVENNGTRKTFLDDLGCDVVYTEDNRFSFRHKGGNELLDIKDVITKYNICDNDMIIKLTGRYKTLSNHFVNLVVNNGDKTDAFVKFFNVCTLKYRENKDDCVLGLFALRCKHLKTFDYKYEKSPECEFAEYIKETIDNTRLVCVKDLSLECCFADNLRKLIV